MWVWESNFRRAASALDCWTVSFRSCLVNWNWTSVSRPAMKSVFIQTPHSTAAILVLQGTRLCTLQWLRDKQGLLGLLCTVFLPGSKAFRERMRSLLSLVLSFSTTVTKLIHIPCHWWWWFGCEVLRHQKRRLKDKSPRTEQDTAQCSFLIFSCHWNHLEDFHYLELQLLIFCVCMWVCHGKHVEVRGQLVELLPSPM